MVVWDTRSLQPVSGFLESGFYSSGPITLDEKCAGARSAGNPHAACDVAGVGDGITEGPKRARRWKRRIQPRHFLRIYAPALDPTNGERRYLWRAVDQDGDVIDILVQSRRNRRAAERFFRKLLKGQGKPPLRLVTDKLKSYSAALRTIMPSVNHDTQQYANNRAEVSHEPTRQRGRQMRRFKSARQAQLFLSVHGVVQNFFRLARHRLKSVHHRLLRALSFATWEAVTAA